MNGVEWTPDGKIVYTATTGKNLSIWIMDEDGKNERQLIPTGGKNISPTCGQRRVYSFRVDQERQECSLRARTDGSEMRQLTDDEFAGQPHVSPDGKWVVYVSSSGTERTVWRIPSDGGEKTRILDMEASWVRVSPDSRLVASGVSVGGKPKLGVFPIDGSSPPRVFDVRRRQTFASASDGLPTESS